MRTAAVSAVAVQTLAPNAQTLGILGSGVRPAPTSKLSGTSTQPSAIQPQSKYGPATRKNLAALAAETGATAASIEEAAPRT